MSAEQYDSYPGSAIAGLFRRWSPRRWSPRRWSPRPRRRRGRILAIKWGLNPNSSSLGVDVTFLLFGAAALALATPIIAALLRTRTAKQFHDRTDHDNGS